METHESTMACHSMAPAYMKRRLRSSLSGLPQVQYRGITSWRLDGSGRWVGDYGLVLLAHQTVVEPSEYA